jgi:hypothetical protein
VNKQAVEMATGQKHGSGIKVGDLKDMVGQLDKLGRSPNITADALRDNVNGKKLQGNGQKAAIQLMSNSKQLNYLDDGKRRPNHHGFA